MILILHTMYAAEFQLWQLFLIIYVVYNFEHFPYLNTVITHNNACTSVTSLAFGHIHQAGHTNYNHKAETAIYFAM